MLDRDGTPREVKRVTMGCNAGAAATLAVAVAARDLRILSMYLAAVTAPVGIQLGHDDEGTFGADFLATICPTGQGIVLPFNEKGWYETTAGNPIQLDVAVASAVFATIQYAEVLP